MPTKRSRSFTATSGSIFQLKVRLLGVSPMVWRRLLVPMSYTLHELHGVLQAAMGWEGLHLFELRVRGVGYGSFDLHLEDPKVPLESFGFRKNGKLAYIYDMGDWWEHEVRIEDRLEAVGGKRYPVCIDGAGTCPPEDCGGPEGYPARREEATGYDAMMDLSTMAEILQEVVLDGKPEALDDDERRWELEMAVEHSKAREPFLASGFSRREVNARFRNDEHRRLMHQWY